GRTASHRDRAEGRGERAARAGASNRRGRRSAEAVRPRGGGAGDDPGPAPGDPGYDAGGGRAAPGGELPPRRGGLRPLPRDHGGRRRFRLRRVVRLRALRGEGEGGHQGDDSGPAVRRVPDAGAAEALPRVRRRGPGGGGLGTSLLTKQDSHFRHRDGKLYCEGVPAEELVAAYGTPLYVYSRSSIVERYRELDRAFSGVDRLIAYSVKANGNLSILQLLAREGAGADIVSGGELQRALLAGVAPEKIVFSGVGKTIQEMAAALEAGIYGFDIESESELRVLSELASTVGKVAPIALRINPDIESPTPHAYTRTGHRATKFGIPSEDALRLYQ